MSLAVHAMGAVMGVSRTKALRPARLRGGELDPLDKSMRSEEEEADTSGDDILFERGEDGPASELPL